MKNIPKDALQRKLMDLNPHWDIGLIPAYYSRFRKRQYFNSLLNLFETVGFRRAGSELSYEALGKSSGVAKNTVKKYLEYLEAAFLIKIVHRISEDGKAFKRVTQFKVYLTDPSIYTAIHNFIKDEDNLDYQNIKMNFIPSALQCYLVGYNIVKNLDWYKESLRFNMPSI